ncbi:MAG TPA: tyrosine-type recombinase/integrase [Microlunatus sp.]
MSLDLECLDRIYLNGYVPNLQVGGQVVQFLALRGFPILATKDRLVTGARTEELRALTWDHMNLDSQPPFVELWRSVREGNDTKTSMSRRTLELPRRAVDALRAHEPVQQLARLVAGDRRVETDLVFASSVGTQLDASNVRRAFRKVAHDAGLDETAWTPRELRHSFVSLLLSSSEVPIEDIARLVGHANTRTTEKVYRKELRPVLTRGAAAMDKIFSQSSDGT